MCGRTGDGTRRRWRVELPRRNKRRWAVRWENRIRRIWRIRILDILCDVDLRRVAEEKNAKAGYATIGAARFA